MPLSCGMKRQCRRCYGAVRGCCSSDLPTEGKTRTLFEVIKRLSGCHRREASSRSCALERSDISAQGQRVVLLLDDLADWAGSSGRTFFMRKGALVSLTEECAVAATGRDGPDLADIRLTATPLRAVYDALRVKLILKPATDDEKRGVVEQLRREEGHYPTLGSICLQNAFEIMRLRFDAQSPAAQDALRAIQILVGCTIEPMSLLRGAKSCSGTHSIAR